MIEMELKAAIDDKLALERQLKAKGCNISGVSIQKDTIYEKPSLIINESNPIFRIRQCNDNVILTLKVLEKDINTAKELELLISDAEIMHNMLNVLGFKPTITVIKERQETVYKGFNICLDYVEGIGSFIEIEKLLESCVDKDQIYEEMKKILLELKVKETNFVKEKYYEMLQNRGGKKV